MLPDVRDVAGDKYICKALKVVQQSYNRSATNTKACSNKSTTSSQPLPQVQRQVKEQAVLLNLYFFVHSISAHYTIASL